MERLRRGARERFEELGWPTKKKPGYAHIPTRLLPAALRGQVSGGKQEASVSEGVIARPLEEALRTFGTFLRARWQRLVKEEIDPFAVLNGALHDEGLFLYVPPQVSASVQLSERDLLHPRVHLFVSAGASLELLVERHTNGWMNAFLDVSVEEDAQLFLTLLGPSSGPFSEAVRATVKRRGVLHCTALSQGNAMHRQDYRVTLLGERAQASLHGAWVSSTGASMHTQVLMEHRAPGCVSRQLFKGVLSGTARSSFAGKIFVHREAQLTDAVQMNHNIALSEGALAVSQPDLEIFADDVKCTHGSTTGQLDEEALLYLRTRGVSESEGRRLLLRAFLQKVFEGGKFTQTLQTRLQQFLG